MADFTEKIRAKKLHAFFDEWEADAVTKENMENAMEKSSGRIVYL